MMALLPSAGCHALMVEPEPTVTDTVVWVQFQTEPAASSHAFGDFTETLAQVTRVSLTLVEGGHSRDTVVAARLEGARLLARAGLRLEEAGGWLELRARLELLHGPTVFTGHALVQTDRVSPTVVVELTPVAFQLLVPSGYPTLTALGDTLALSAHPIFATGDTIFGASVEWSVGAPALLELTDGGRVVARGNGSAVVRAASLGSVIDRVVTVRQAVAQLTGIGPADTLVSVGDTFQVRAFGEDPNGFPLLGGANVQWSSGGSVSVDSNGRVAASSVGVGFVDVVAGSVSHRAVITVGP